MIYSIVDFGAVQSDALNTTAIQAAIDACFTNGGGEVIIPAGFWRTGGFRLRSHVTLHLLSGAYLEASVNPDDYDSFREDSLEPLDPEKPGVQRSASMMSHWNNAIIRAIGAEDVAIIGEPYSVIDGCNCYDETNEENYRGPHGINMWHCKNVTLSGYTVRNSANWAHAIFYSENVDINNVTVLGGHDGVDLFLCENSTVRDCKFYTGDDCIAGFGSRNVYIRDCIFAGACSAIRFGGTNVLIEHCRIEKSAPYGFRGQLTTEKKRLRMMPEAASRHSTKYAFLYYCDQRFGELPYRPGNILVRDCDFSRVQALFNMPFGEHKWCNNAPLESIRFENCRAAGITEPSYIHGDPEAPIDFSLCDVTLERASGENEIIRARDFKRISLERVKLVGYDSPCILSECESGIDLADSDAIEIKTSENVPGLTE